MKKNFINRAMSLILPVAVAAGTFQMPTLALAQKQVDRPIQYVALAFDGSYRNATWQYLRNFSQNKKQNGIDVRFTFFINPVYLFEKPVGLQIYHPPGGHHGSNIGWGDDRNDIATRLDNMNAAFDEGHEIGSHAVGHFDGGTWSAEEWKSEFDQFYYMLDNVFSLNRLPIKPLNFRNSIVGFRAPLLGYSPGLYAELPKYGMKYDTSQQSQGMDYWPQIRSDANLWNFPLARVMIPGKGRAYPTMDYNFCANDSLELLRANPDLINYTGPDALTGKMLANKGKGDCLPVVPPDVKKFIKDRTIAAYMNYFNNNYYGSRAPISIGHHFSPWMSGAYFEAMMTIADTVCGKPEVKCVTYQELRSFMKEKTATGEMASYRVGAFEKLPRPKAARAERALDLSAVMIKQGEDLRIELSGRDASAKGLKVSFNVEGKEIPGANLSMNQIRNMSPVGAKIKVAAVAKNRQGMEVYASTHVIENIGTNEEKFNTEDLESSFQKGDMPAAHEGDNAEDFTLGH